jgi:endonuclease-3 related protein
MADDASRQAFRPPRWLLTDLHDRLLDVYGPQRWWPAETRLEIIVGAVLTQNTAWANVERALDNLRQARALSLSRLLALPHEALAELLHPAGYFNVKARRLVNLLNAVPRRGGLRAMDGMETAALRQRLLAVNGIGPETADDILLYAFGRPVFVIDAYTRRLFARLGLARGNEAYDDLRRGVEGALPGAVGWYQEFHALVVAHAKQRCRPTPDCPACPIRKVCGFQGALRG